MPRARHLLGPPDEDQGEQVEDIYGDRFVRPEWVDPEEDEALSHCPQCGSGKFTEYRTDQPTAT